MAHKKAGGSSRNGRDSAGRRLGLKLFGGQIADRRQYPCASARHHVASRVKMSAWARITRFSHSLTDALQFNTKAKGRTFISVVPMTEAAAE